MTGSFLVSICTKALRHRTKFHHGIMSFQGGNLEGIARYTETLESHQISGQGKVKRNLNWNLKNVP